MDLRDRWWRGVLADTEATLNEALEDYADANF